MAIENKVSFSVLIPNYGFNPYLFECLMSVVNQENVDSVSDIIIYDQSSDDVYEKIVNLVNSNCLFSKIKVVHSSVKGLFKARHSLMDFASGKYIIFLDSDDFLKDGFFAEAQKELEQHSYPDILIHELIKCDVNGKPIPNETPANIENHIFDYFYFTGFLNSVCCKIFKKELYDLNDYQNYSFDITLGEDKAFSIPLMKKASNVVYSKVLKHYMYRMVSSSMVHSFSIEECKDLFSDVCPSEQIVPTTQFQKELKLDTTISLYTTSISVLKKNKQLTKQLFMELSKIVNDTIQKYSLTLTSTLKFKRKVVYFLLNHRLFTFLYILFKL